MTPGTAPPVFSVIILNWNGKHLLKECLDSVLAQRFHDFEIVVVDNGSTDDSAEFVRREYGDRVRLFAIEKNLGFSGGNNVGIGRARGKWAVFLNNDTQADPHWLEELHGAAFRHPDVPVFACKVLNYFRRDEIDTVGHLLYPDGISRGRGRLEMDNGQYDKEEEVIFPSGCAAAYSMDLLHAIGGFDESFFAYCDDTELGLRARLFGARCLLVPRAIVYHKYSATGGIYSEFKVYHVERNRFWVMVKYFPLRWILLSPFYTAFRMANHFLAALGRRGASGRFAKDRSVLTLFRIVLRAYGDAFARLPAVLHDRRTLRKLRKTTPSQFTEWLTRFRLTAREAAWKD